jgi:hypothetical protein
LYNSRVSNLELEQRRSARSNIPNNHDPQSLYFLSLNGNNHNRVYYENRAHHDRRFIHLENINTDAYSSALDDPPDYYEVTSIKKSKYDTNKKRLSSVSLNLARVSLNENISPTPTSPTTEAQIPTVSLEAAFNGA